MTRSELQDKIIKKVLDTTDTNLLDYMNNLLNNASDTSIYNLSETEKKVLAESLEEYAKGNVISGEEVNSRNKKWLEK